MDRRHLKSYVHGGTGLFWNRLQQRVSIWECRGGCKDVFSASCEYLRWGSQTVWRMPRGEQGRLLLISLRTLTLVREVPEAPLHLGRGPQAGTAQHSTAKSLTSGGSQGGPKELPPGLSPGESGNLSALHPPGHIYPIGLCLLLSPPPDLGDPQEGGHHVPPITPERPGAQRGDPFGRPVAGLGRRRLAPQSAEAEPELGSPTLSPYFPELLEGFQHIIAQALSQGIATGIQRKSRSSRRSSSHGTPGDHPNQPATSAREHRQSSPSTSSQNSTGFCVR